MKLFFAILGGTLGSGLLGLILYAWRKHVLKRRRAAKRLNDLRLLLIKKRLSEIREDREDRMQQAAQDAEASVADLRQELRELDLEKDRRRKRERIENFNAEIRRRLHRLQEGLPS